MPRTHRRKAATAPRHKAHRASTRHHSPTRSTRRSTKAVPRRRSYARRKKGMLAEMFTPSSAMQAGTAMLMGGLGGVVANKAVEDLFGTSIKKGGKVGILAGISFFLAAVMKAPMAAAGVAAVAGIELSKPATTTAATKALAERGYLQENYLSQLPETLSDGYLSESFLSDGYLSSNAAYGTEDADYQLM